MKKLKVLFFDQYVSTPFNAPNTLLTSHYQQYEYCLAVAMTLPLQKLFLVLLKRERVTHRKYTTRDEARADILMTLNNFIVNENNDS